MATMQIRNVPEETSRILKARAAAEGRSLSEYLLREVTRLAARPTTAELLARVDARGRVAGLPPAADVLREARRGR